MKKYIQYNLSSIGLWNIKTCWIFHVCYEYNNFFRFFLVVFLFCNLFCNNFRVSERVVERERRRRKKKREKRHIKREKEAFEEEERVMKK